MTKRRPVERKFSEEAKQNIRLGAAKRSETIVLANRTAVRAALAEIKAEVMKNGGIYPHPTKLNLSEVARRSAVTLPVLYKKPYAIFLSHIRRWLDAIHTRQEVVQGGTTEKEPSRRRSLKERLESWRSEYQRLSDSHIKTELDLLAAQEENAKLKEQNNDLLRQLREQTKLQAIRPLK